jgi:hypothetical protein
VEAFATHYGHVVEFRSEFSPHGMWQGRAEYRRTHRPVFVQEARTGSDSPPITLGSRGSGQLANIPRSNTRVHQSPGIRTQRHPGKAPSNIPGRCRKMYQHKQRYFHARHRRPPPTIKWHYAARKDPLPRNLGPGRVRTPFAARSAGAARSRTCRRPPAARRGPLRPPQYARRHTGSWRPRVSCGSTHSDRDRAYTTPLSMRPSLRRHARDDGVGPPCADSSPTPAMTHGGSAARSARPQRGQLPSRTPCSRNRPEPRKGAERRARIRNPSPLTHQDVGAR